jgi:hypothetical protein
MLNYKGDPRGSQVRVPATGRRSEGSGMRRTLWGGLAVALAVFLGLGVVALLWWGNRTRPASIVPAEQPAYARPGLAAIEPPSVTFTDVTELCGVRFVHYHGGYGKKLLPETMGAGVVVFDYNQDGHQDLLFVNSSHWPHHTYDVPPPRARMALYRNDGTGRFQDVTEEAGLGHIECYGMGAAAGDIDNDGYPDLVVTALGRCYLLHNQQGLRFRDITEEAGVVCPGWSTSAAFLDYDLDGKLDLFICHYVRWTPETDLHCTLIGSEKSYCQPFLYEGEHCQLFRNCGELRFEDVSRAAGLHLYDVLGQKPASKALGVAVHDYNDDGWPDIAVANDTTPNFLFHNNGDGTFTNVAGRKGVELLNEGRGTARGAMGIFWGYYRDGETLGLAIANFSNEPNGLLKYVKRRDLFTDVATAEGVGGPSRLPLKFGLFFFDYDLDGRLDLFTSNGHIEPEIARVQAGASYAQPPQLFWNAGPSSEGCYREVEPRHAGRDLFVPRVGRGAAFGDLDGDGDQDIVLSNNNQPATVLRNDCPPTARALRIRLRGTRANRDGYGARVRVWAGGSLRQAELCSGGSYLSQCEAVLTFGLGPHEIAERVEILWPTRERNSSTFTDLKAGYTYWIDETEGVIEARPFRRDVPGV